MSHVNLAGCAWLFADKKTVAVFYQYENYCWPLCNAVCIFDESVKTYSLAATCDFQHCGILTSVDSDEPMQPPFRLRSPKCYSVSSLTFLDYSSD